MKAKISLLILIFFAGSLGLAGVCNDLPQLNSSIFSHEGTDDFVPYPWGAELPFPWIKVQGLWLANIGVSQQAYYTFEVVRENEFTEKQLLIKQYDSKSCNLIATGVGIENDRKTIWAYMKNVGAPKTYRLGLRNFSADSLPKYLPNDEGRVMVMSVSISGSLKFHYYPLQKITNLFDVKAQNCQWSR